MPQITVLTDGEARALTRAVERFAGLDETSMDDLFERDVDGGNVEVRCFPMDADDAAGGPTASIYFEVSVDRDAEWYDDGLGAYSADNLRNGGPIYVTLAAELEDAVEDALGTRPAFVKEKGSGAFTATVEVER